ncbi:heparan-alpha-glucosaminide N-acetyltransferase domain-containing protein [Nocardia sp. NPDC127526]|uniref:heparan-alpha-glucosaminide N-acetyltransferase domain-containing protein n=1 Tax=Nocardia sp. NPDC127526 TaxID=3345393 RepID=UPI00363A8FE5
MWSSKTVDAQQRSGPADSLPRVLALDAARGIAVLGMFAVHVGPQPAVPGGESWLTIFQGRSAALFAILAGVSLALMSGGQRPYTGKAAQRGMVRIAARAVIVALLGLALALLQSGIGIMLILTYYGLYFLLALPFLRASARTLALLAAAWAIAGPVVSFLIRSRMEQNSFGGSPTPEMLTSLSGLREMAEMLLLTGAYPVLSWMPFVLAGMALGRLGIRALQPVSVMLAGAGLMVLGYGGSWLLQHPCGGRAHLTDLLAHGLSEAGVTDIDLGAIIDAGNLGTVSTTSWWWLTVATPHSGTPFEVIGATGAAFLVIGALLAITPRAGIALRPLIAAGSCALSLYILQAVAVSVLVPIPDADAEALPGGIHGPGWPLLALLALGSLTLATLWRSASRRGPAEWALHEISWRTAKWAVPVG